MTTTTKPIQAVKEFFERRKAQNTQTIHEAKQAYRETVKAISRGEENVLGSDDDALEALLEDLRKSHADFEADCHRAVQFSETAEVRDRLPKLEAAHVAAETAYDEFVAETEQIVESRESQRIKLLNEYSEIEGRVAAARSHLSNPPTPEQLPEEFRSRLGEITSCLQSASRALSTMHHESMAAERELARLKSEVERAEGATAAGKAAERLAQRQSLLESIIETSQSMEKRAANLRSFEERARTQLICPDTGLAIDAVSVEEFFDGVDTSKFEVPSHLFA